MGDTMMSNTDIVDSVISLSVAGLLFYMAHNIVRDILLDETAHTFTWIKPDEYKELEKVAGRWAIERTLSLLPPNTPLPTIKKVAKQMQSKIFELYGIPPEEIEEEEKPVPAEVPAKKAKPKHKATVTPEEKEKIKETPKKKKEVTEDTIRYLTDLLIDAMNQTPAIAKQSDDELAKTVSAWAEVDFGLKLPYDIASSIVQKAREGIKKSI